MKHLLLLLSISLVLSGCGQTAIESPVVTEGLTGDLDLSLVMEEEVEQEIPANWGTYVNSRFGYQFSYPTAGVLWSQISAGEQQYVVEANETSKIVQFTDASLEALADPETNRLVVEVVEGQRSAHEWLSLHLEEYFVGGNAGQTVSEFAGGEAMVLVGSAHADSPAKMIVMQKDDLVYLVYYLNDSFTFEDVLSTFQFL